MSKKKQLNDEDLQHISGGSDEGQEISFGLFHTDCGGKLLHVNNPFMYVECAKCHQENYLTTSFERYQIYKKINYGLRYYHSGHIDYHFAADNIARPEELDWPCNKSED